MSINSMIIGAIVPVVAVCVPETYTGTATEYAVFEYEETPAFYADDVPMAFRYDITLHWYLPEGMNPLTKKALIKAALVSVGCSYPTILPVGDTDGQHYVFECTYTEVAQ